ncbi:serine/threonine-protein kinase, partial [Streptomyces sp. NPDC058953]|uniref:serine/threonine-protein kinase n=1 Tax=Streptomyces sp. NPDC058953 TaxID=3346676 RepID=UPI0036B275EB
MERLLPEDPSRLDAYRLLGRLGAGGMGVVYLARAADGDLAAIKVIQPDFAAEPSFRARFRREVATARRVRSPWVVPVLDADTEAGAPWLATAFVPGPSLAEAVVECGPLPPEAVRVLGKVLARALTEVHAAGLVHRDVKPGNVLLAMNGPRLIDFGIARSTSAEATELTSAGVVVGTPGFLAPEQARADTVGPAADIFSLACVLAYAATGRPPFGSGAVDALLYRTVHDAPDLADVRDEGLRDLLGRCLAKDPAGPPGAALVDGAQTGDAPAGTIDWLPDRGGSVIARRAVPVLARP